MNPAYDHVVPCGRSAVHDAHSYDAGGLWFVTCPGVDGLVDGVVDALVAAFGRVVDGVRAR